MLEQYNTAYTLILDPELVFSTYSGGVSSDFYAFTTTYDKFENVYAGGIAFGLGWPVSTGSFQTTFEGVVDVIIIKYAPNGSNKLMATYYGGSHEDLPISLSVNGNGDIAIGGHSTSINLPMLSNTFDNTNGNIPRNNLNNSGSSDLFLAVFNSTGTNLIGASYIGGSSQELILTSMFNFINSMLKLNNSRICPMHIQFDSLGENIWLLSNTTSLNFPVTSNAFQGTMSGYSDAVLVKMNKNCNDLLFSSYFGAPDLEFPTHFVLKGNHQLIGTMATMSNNLPIFNNSFDFSYNGLQDGYVFILNLNTLTITNSTYLGTDSVDGQIK